MAATGSKQNIKNLPKIKQAEPMRKFELYKESFL